MSQPSVVMCSMFRNDADRAIVDRVEHLLAKEESWPNLRYVWLVGDSTDGTARILAHLCNGYDNVRIAEITTGIEGDDADSRLRRLGATANHYFGFVDGADYVIIHESDILSPYNLVSRMVSLAERGICPVAAWPVIEIGGQRLCYDIWALRENGIVFRHTPPYHPAYEPDRPFRVDSFGTCFIMHGEDAPLIQMRDRAVLDLCYQLRQAGRTLWVDPTLIVEQPVELWQYHYIGEYA